eukprot:2144207-Amphidinium_carterae.1
MDHLRQHFGCAVTLRGQGSGTMEPSTGHLCMQSHCPATPQHNGQLRPHDKLQNEAGSLR